MYIYKHVEHIDTSVIIAFVATITYMSVYIYETITIVLLKASFCYSTLIMIFILMLFNDRRLGSHSTRKVEQLRNLVSLVVEALKTLMLRRWLRLWS